VTALRYTIYTRLVAADYRHVRQEAAARGITIAACVTDLLREYFALRNEMATSLTAAGQPGTRHTGMIHSLLARSEERLAATLEARAGTIFDDLRLVTSMLDRLAQLYLLHTPEVARELHAGAVASANRRYASWRQAVSDLIAAGGVNGVGPRSRLGEGDGR
jgi:hypothetical protein